MGLYEDFSNLEHLPEQKTCQQLGIQEEDRFVVLHGNMGQPVGTILILDEDDGSTCPYFRLEGEPKGTHNMAPSLYQLGRLPKNNSVKTFMANIIEKVRSLTLSVEDKLLQKHGIESPTGVPTHEGIELMIEILYRENRAKVITEVTKIEEAEKAEKKA